MSTSCTASRGFKARRGRPKRSSFAERSENLGYDLQQVGLVSLDRGRSPTRAEPGPSGTELRYRLEDARVSNVSSDLEAQGVEPGTERIASPTPTVVRDLRDDRFNPRRGSVHQASLELADRSTRRDRRLRQVGSSRRAGFFSWSCRRRVRRSRAGLGPVGPLRWNARAFPIQDRFFTGGSTSVRGFPEDKLGPLDSAGNPLWQETPSSC